MNDTLTFTGHRPQAWRNDVDGWLWTYLELELAIERSISNGFTKFIVGGALGFDRAACVILLILQKKNPSLYITLAQPFPGQASLWSTGDQMIHHLLCELVDEVVIVSDGVYEVQKMHIRNHWMVDRSQALIAGWQSTKKRGGTIECAKYARKVGIPIFQIDSAKKKTQWHT